MLYYEWVKNPDSRMKSTIEMIYLIRKENA